MAAVAVLKFLYMHNSARISFTGSLPESFFRIPEKLYAGLSFDLKEEPTAILELLRHELLKNEIILYTDHQEVRLMGIFPHHADTAYFAFWETTEDSQNNRLAFKLFEADARQRGRHSISGPFHFNTFHRYRLRLGPVPSWQAFDREPVNPTYYPRLLEAVGYQPTLRFESRLIRTTEVPAVYQDKQAFLESLQQLPYEFIPLNPTSWEQYEDKIFELVLAIFSQNPGFKTVSKKEFNLLYNSSFAKKLCPYTSVLFKEKSSGKLVAMSFCHPNYQSLGHGPGYAYSFEKDYPRLEKKILLAKSVGVHPDYRKAGLMNYLGAYGMLHFRRLYSEVLFCLMRSDNFSLHFTDDLAYEAAQYALYGKEVEM